MSGTSESVESRLPSVHTCYYGSFFLLRMPVVFHGVPAEIKLDKSRNAVLSFSLSKSTVNLSLASVSELVARSLQKYGVDRVDTFYYEEVPLFSVAFESEYALKAFINSANGQVRDEVRKALADAIQKPVFHTRTFPAAVSMPLDVTLELYHITPDHLQRSAQARLVDLDTYKQYAKLWRESELFTFQSLFTAGASAQRPLLRCKFLML